MKKNTVTSPKGLRDRDSLQRHPFYEFGIQISGLEVELVDSEQAERQAGDLLLAATPVPHWNTGFTLRDATMNQGRTPLAQLKRCFQVVRQEGAGTLISASSIDP